VRETDDRIGNPVAVVAVMQTFDRTVDRQLGVDHAAGAENELHAAALVDWTVAEDPGVGAEDVRIFREVVAEVRGAGFFFPFEDETEIDVRLAARFAKLIE